MKKTITLTDDQVVTMGVSISMHISMMNKLLESAQESGEAGLIFEKDIAALEQVKAAIRRAKWEF